MGEFVTREHQRALLEELKDVYPEVKPYRFNGDEAGRRATANLHYLLEHSLIEGKIRLSSAGDRSSICAVRLTHKGLDFLLDDGGLSAILGVVTVKLHDDSIRQLLINRVDADTKATPEERDALRDKIRKLPAEMLGTVVSEATKEGLKHVPDLAAWLFHTLPHALQVTTIA